jgi:hypothetical protein
VQWSALPRPLGVFTEQLLDSRKVIRCQSRTKPYQEVTSFSWRQRMHANAVAEDALEISLIHKVRSGSKLLKLG